MQSGDNVSRIGESGRNRGKRGALIGAAGAERAACLEHVFVREGHRCRPYKSPNPNTHASARVSKPRRIRIHGRAIYRVRPPFVGQLHLHAINTAGSKE